METAHGPTLPREALDDLEMMWRWGARSDSADSSPGEFPCSVILRPTTRAGGRDTAQQIMLATSPRVRQETVSTGPGRLHKANHPGNRSRRQ